jgi:AbrB family looped-hinge helix DNA binding protein
LRISGFASQDLMALAVANWHARLPISMETTLDRFGRVLIPKRVRDDLGLHAGAVLAVEGQTRQIVLRPLEGEPGLVRKGRVLVFAGAAAGDLTAAVRTHREERLRNVARRARK